MLASVSLALGLLAANKTLCVPYAALVIAMILLGVRLTVYRSVYGPSNFREE